MDALRPWPGPVEPLRPAFATQSATDGPLLDGFTYIRAPLPQGCGFPACLIGLRAENGTPVAVRYAVPGRYAPLPPEGLEAYRWIGGPGEGYWLLTADAATGEPQWTD